MIKAVFLDMDGTVISHKQGKVLESTKDVTFPMSGGYKELNRDEILRIFKESLQRKFTKKSHQEMSV